MTSPTPSPNDRTPNPDITEQQSDLSSPAQSSENSEGNPDDDWNFDQALQEVEQSLSNLKQRYLEVERNQAQQSQLRQREAELKQELRRTPSYERSRRQPLRKELQHIQQQLESIELTLESQLFSLSSFKEPFWQAVRFAGLGVIIGWILKACTG